MTKVHRGQMLFMEPQQSNLNNKLREYQIQEKREERIHWELFKTHALYEFTVSNHYIGTSDGNAKRVRLRIATEPIVDANNYVALWQAWHPLLEREKAVANDMPLLVKNIKRLSLQGRIRVGNHSLWRRSVWFTWWHRLGCIFPQPSGSLYRDFCDDLRWTIDWKKNLSTFIVSNIVPILKQINDKSLILIDEIGSSDRPNKKGLFYSCDRNPWIILQVSKVMWLHNALSRVESIRLWPP